MTDKKKLKMYHTGGNDFNWTNVEPKIIPQKEYDNEPGECKPNTHKFTFRWKDYFNFQDELAGEGKHYYCSNCERSYDSAIHKDNILLEKSRIEQLEKDNKEMYDMLDNVRYWETCPDEYKERIDKLTGNNTNELIGKTAKADLLAILRKSL